MSIYCIASTRSIDGIKHVCTRFQNSTPRRPRRHGRAGALDRVMRQPAGNLRGKWDARYPAARKRDARKGLTRNRDPTKINRLLHSVEDYYTVPSLKSFQSEVSVLSCWRTHPHTHIRADSGSQFMTMTNEPSVNWPVTGVTHDPWPMTHDYSPVTVTVWRLRTLGTGKEVSTRFDFILCLRPPLGAQ